MKDICRKCGVTLHTPKELYNQIALGEQEPKEGFIRGLWDAMADLTPRERQVLIWRYGLDGQEPQFLREIAEKLHVTRERIRQIESKAIRKLRHPARSQCLRPYLDKC